MTFQQRLKKEIQLHGPMTVAQFMGHCVQHYYDSRDPFGTAGDFTTAPEISQMFGELLGAWAADTWIKLGSPPAFILAEAGPGRGTLMADALRGTKNVSGFHAALSIHLIETSETLRRQQKKRLKDYHVKWHADIQDLPDDKPIIMLANELLDALPVRQWQWAGGHWHERVISLNSRDEFEIGIVPVAEDVLKTPRGLPTPEEGAIFEFSTARENFVESVTQRLKRQGGAALFIDYGHIQSEYGDTLQALKHHKYVSATHEPGETDLTSHVDFQALNFVAAAAGMHVYGPAAQGAFLQTLGLSVRAAVLKKNASPEQAKEIDAAVHRLTDAAEMGELFKVMAISTEKLNLAGLT